MYRVAVCLELSTEQIGVLFGTAGLDYVDKLTEEYGRRYLNTDGTLKSVPISQDSRRSKKRAKGRSTS
jgi:hypothetical protein